MSLDASPTPDYSASIDFLQWWLPGGPWVLTSIIPDPLEKGRKTFTDTFGGNDVKSGRLLRWLEEHGTQWRRNIYWTPNGCRKQTVKEKPKKVDIGAMFVLHVDLDPRAGEDRAAERERIFKLLKDPTHLGIPKPTVIVDSGNGGQAFWRLRVPFQIAEATEAAADDAGLWNRHLGNLLGGDATHNVDRVMRLPGTVNWPDAKKREKGRVPVLAAVVEFNDERHDLDGFEKAEPVRACVSSSSNGAVAAAGRTVELSGKVHRFACADDIKELLDESDARNAVCRVVIVQGRDPDKPSKSRSEPLLFVCCQMHRAGCSDDAIYSVITDPAFPISESVLDKGAGIEAYAIKQIESAHEKVEVEAEEFQKDKDGKLYTNLHNARLALRKLGVRLEFDEFADRAQVLGLPDFGPQLDDAAVTRLWLAVEERFRLVYPKERFVAIVSDAARQNRRHPVREFLDGLTWDSTPRLDGWLSSYLGAEDTEYTRAVGTLVLVAAVRRVRQPGCKFDEMLVLEGLQGTDKSNALKVLAVVEDWFSDDLPLNAKAQQFIEQTTGKWIVEAGELKGMRKGDVDALKSCLSRQRDRARMAFGRLPLERARQFVIIGTTNSEHYLKDNTGNRRFWPVRMGEVRLADLRRDREQLWAEAAAREAAGASIRLDPALYGAAGKEQEARRVEDPWVQVLAEHLGDLEGKFRTTDAWEIVGVTKDRRTQQDNVRLGEAMRELGWERKLLSFGGKTGWCYVRGAGVKNHHPAIMLVWEPESPGSPVRVLRLHVEGDPAPESPPDDGEVLG
ncbi:MAG: hypothetical protein GC161_16260 [Planctomycetaceae bacterium]|nr:hypothetical protein [Planctomycetaceae bacterium]